VLRVVAARLLRGPRAARLHTIAIGVKHGEYRKCLPYLDRLPGVSRNKHYDLYEFLYLYR